MTKSPCLMTQHTMGYIFRFVWNRVRYPRIWWLFIILQWPFWGVYLIFRQTHFRLTSLVTRCRLAIVQKEVNLWPTSIKERWPAKIRNPISRQVVMSFTSSSAMAITDGHHRAPLFWTLPRAQGRLSPMTSMEKLLRPSWDGPGPPGPPGGLVHHEGLEDPYWKMLTQTPIIHLRTIITRDCLIATMFFWLLLLSLFTAYYCLHHHI